jgi:ADP-heptose:LPS heptosyltransferase
MRVDMNTCGPSSGSAPEFLVIQLARFGDLVQTGRLIASLREQGRVHLLVDRSLAELARLVHPGVTVHGLPAHGSHGPDILGPAYADLAAISGHRFHRVYNLNFSGQSFALSSLFPPDTVRGYRQEAGQRLVDSWPAQVMRWTRSRVGAGLNLVDVWGLYADQPISPERVNPAASPRGGGLGVVMAGRNARRSLPVPLLASLVQAAMGRVGHGPVTLLGAGGERRAARELTALLPAALRGQVRDLVGGTDWRELIDVVGGLDLALTPDTGTMHLAAHLWVPVLAFFLSSAWCHETGPYGRGHLVLQAATDCAPCLETEPCPHDVLCRRVFGDPGLLRFVGGRADRELPSGCAAMASDFDGLGLTFTAVAGRDPHAARRRAFRAEAAAYAGAPIPEGWKPATDESWIRERDWMLPQNLRGRAHE